MAAAMTGGGAIPILVTGGAGYVGADACKALADRGYRPIVYDNLVYGHQAPVQWGLLEVGDIADRARLDVVFARHQPQAEMHFAAFTYVGFPRTAMGGSFVGTANFSFLSDAVQFLDEEKRPQIAPGPFVTLLKAG